MLYGGFITCDIEEQEDEVKLKFFTLLYRSEFQELVFECSSTPKIFQYQRVETLL